MGPRAQSNLLVQSPFCTILARWYNTILPFCFAFQSAKMLTSESNVIVRQSISERIKTLVTTRPTYYVVRREVGDPNYVRTYTGR